LLPDESVLDLAARASADPAACPCWGRDLVSLIEGGDRAVAWAGAQLDPSCADPAAVVKPGEYTLLAPIPRPRKNVFCVGLNYRDHVAEHDREGHPARPLPTTPVYFTKPPTSVNAPGADIPWHPVTAKLDYEVELGVVIGKRGRDIAPADVLDHIFGYTIVNDVTARDLQSGHGGQWFKGKALDGACPMGPAIVHRSAVPHADNLDFVCRVNGEVRQQSNTSRMIFDIPTLISTLSAGLTLEPGDIVATGTCSGVGSGFTPPRFLRDGDEVEMAIEGIGTLRNRVRRV
jgi:2-keto-4-pentenoate hydratase/2-oxohepta-3-ene-1,7-dioic acid hydratase in catechol pathway